MPLGNSGEHSVESSYTMLGWSSKDASHSFDKATTPERAKKYYFSLRWLSMYGYLHTGASVMNPVSDLLITAI